MITLSHRTMNGLRTERNIAAAVRTAYVQSRLISWPRMAFTLFWNGISHVYIFNTCNTRVN